MSKKLGSPTTSKVLQKAISFRDDIKHRIRKQPKDDSVLERSDEKSRHKIQRGGSLREDFKTNKQIEALQKNKHKVETSLLGLQMILDKPELETLLSGSVTLLIEAVIDMLQNVYLPSEPGSALGEAKERLCFGIGSLSELSDSILLSKSTQFDKVAAKPVLKALKDGVEKVYELSVIALNTKSSAQEANELKRRTISTSGSHDGSSSRQSAVVEQQSSPSSYTSAQSAFSEGGATPVAVILEPGGATPIPVIVEPGGAIPVPVTVEPGGATPVPVIKDLENRPPPKPPLPANMDISGVFKTRLQTEFLANNARIQTISGQLSPPPLPPKTRTPSVSTIYDNCTPSKDNSDYFDSSYSETSDLSDRSSAHPSPSHAYTYSHHNGNGLNGVAVRVEHGASDSDSWNDSVYSDSPSINSYLLSTTSPATIRLSHYDNLVDSQRYSPISCEHERLLEEAFDPVHKLDHLSSHLRSLGIGEPDQDKPPQSILRKKSPMHLRHVPSQYDNFMPDTVVPGGVPLKSVKFASKLSSMSSFSSSKDGDIITVSTSSSSFHDGAIPPPLPPKTKPVEAYIQMFGAPVKPSLKELSRHTIQNLNYYQAMWRHDQILLDFQQNSHHQRHGLGFHQRPKTIAANSHSGPVRVEVVQPGTEDVDDPPTLPEKIRKLDQLKRELSIITETPSPDSGDPCRKILCTSYTPQSSQNSDDVSVNMLDSLDVTNELLWKDEDSSEFALLGGTVDALIVHATVSCTNEHMLLYQEAFLTTYRTFISPKDLIEKLIYRYNHFYNMEDVKQCKMSKYAFSLLTRVVNELCTELDPVLLTHLTNFSSQLFKSGELQLAKFLRSKIVEKTEQKNKLVQGLTHHQTLYHQMNLKKLSLADFKAVEIAEQMTLLDEQLFRRIEIGEALLWSKEQNEEKCPNLRIFTEHFNDISYWCRSQILIQKDARDRERYLVKFIKIMKHLRKLHNFNSYLAVLSGVDSAPVRRLEWQKQNVEALHEFCELIDSSASFRSYREALARSKPPCIPYIGLVLQDLTFVHIGNPDLLPNGFVNFSKRWQQFHILDNMRRFVNSHYEFPKNHKIQAMFGDFKNQKSEDELWQISEKIKPRNSSKSK